MPRVKALKSFYFDGEHMMGDIFEAKDVHIGVLLATGSVELAPVAPPVPPPAPAHQADARPLDTRYKRRDMRSEK